MRRIEDLQQELRRIDGRGYKAYKDIEGVYSMGWFELYIDHVQGDPFAAPSRIRGRVYQREAKIPAELFATKPRRVSLEDHLTRLVAYSIERLARGNRGSGKSGLIGIDRPGQEVLERTSVVINSDFVEVRLVAGLPAAGRRVLGQQAEAMLCREIPQIVENSLLGRNIDMNAARKAVELGEDQEYLRALLAERRLVAFVGNGAILPRESGVSDRPMSRERAIPFISPPELEVEFELPNHGKIRGMGIPEGVTLIVGGGYHGKSTLLRAIERGVYNHIRGDGREFVITRGDAVKIRAEDGRRVAKVDISPFINNLPNGEDTKFFSTEEASGSTSQAANIMEALEAGTSLLLIDEDTSATNFMIRDLRMQRLVAKEKEPITPFIDRVRELYEKLGVSTILVLGGSGDYLDVADTVIMMDEYRPVDVTARAREIVKEFPTERVREGAPGFGPMRPRIPLPGGFDPSKGRKRKVDARGLDEVVFGREEIELSFVEGLVHPSQTRAIAAIILYALERYIDARRPLREVIEMVERDIEERGLDVISPFKGGGNYARPRRQEIAAAINRLRTLQIAVRP